MATDYSELDAAILKHIQTTVTHPWPALLGHSAMASVNLWQRQRTIARRLQALRKAGRIRHDRRAVGHGWIIVEEPQQ